MHLHNLLGSGEPGGTGNIETQPHLLEIVAALKEITARITAATALPEAIDDLLTVTAEIVPAYLRCGVMFINEGMPATFSSTDLPSEVVDEARHVEGDGPCMTAVRTRDIVISQDLAEEERWPAWTTLARSHGVCGVLAYPFDVDGAVLGALNLYADKPDALHHEIPIVAMLVADHASLLLRARLRQLSQEDLLAHLEASQPQDISVERAVGIVMAQRGCTPEQALRHLHEAATHLGVGLPAVAERLVRTVSDRGRER